MALKIWLTVSATIFFCSTLTLTEESCSMDASVKCNNDGGTSHLLKAANVGLEGHKQQWDYYLHMIDDALSQYASLSECRDDKCSCHYGQITKDLSLFSSGIDKNLINTSKERGTFYQVIGNRLYRDRECMFPSRCAGIEHFILKIIDNLPDMEMIINTRDWPQVGNNNHRVLPVFSFSKTSEYLDILYPAWTFWEGGPAISLYPTGLGRWDIHRKRLISAATKWPWDLKKNVAFFRGSRTSNERDALVYLSREFSALADAKYTKNQAWKSEADTLYEPPASEVPLEEHCQYKHLFNYRGVAASFRLKHLFLCGSLVFHVGSDWDEFFYPQLKPWVHYVPVPSSAGQKELKLLLEFAQDNDEVMKQIAQRGYEFVRDHLRMKDVTCYWRKLLLTYVKLLTYKPMQDSSLVEIRSKLKS